MGHGSAGGRPIGRSRSTGYLNGQPVLHGRPPTAGKPLTINTGFRQKAYLTSGTMVPEGDLAGGRSKSRLLVLLVIAALLVGAVLLVANRVASSVEYAIIIDSGSTGTRLYVYSWTRPVGVMAMPVVNENRGSGPIQTGNRKMKPRAYRRMETEPGLDKFVGDQVGIKEALSPLLKWALQEVPESHQASTPIFLFATAGLRKLPEQDSQWVLKEVRAVIRDTPFQFRHDYARVISGMDEAVYGWVALNYLTKRLHEGHEGATLGSLDLGGSSLEVTFIPDQVPSLNYGANITVKSSTYHLYAHSHKSYGMNDAFDGSVKHLLAGRKPEGLLDGYPLVRHPCLQQGYNQTYKFLQRPLSRLRLLRKVLAADHADVSKVWLLGEPSWDRCRQLADQVVDASRDCEQAPCALGAHQPKLRGQFYALAGFFVVYHFFGLPTSAPLDKVLELGKEFCEQPWGAVISQHATERNVDRYCFRAPYIASLLRSGLGLDDSQVMIGSGDIGWTLGAALYEGGALRASSVPSSLTSSTGHSLSTLYRDDHTGVDISNLLLSSDTLPFLVIVVFLCIAGLLFTLRWYRSRSRAFARKSYLPVWTYQGVTPAWMLGIQQQGSAEYEKIVPVTSGRRLSMSALEPIPQSPPPIPIKAPSQHPSQSRLATRRVASKEELAEVIRGDSSPDRQERGSHHSP